MHILAEEGIITTVSDLVRYLSVWLPSSAMALFPYH